MNIIAVDDETYPLLDLQAAIEEALPGSLLSCFQSSADALEYAQKTQVDVAFLDIEIGRMNGLILAKRLKEIYNNTNIIFVTGYSHYAAHSYSVQASGYLMKPISAKDVGDAMEYLRHPIKATEERIRVQCFGNFEVFVDNIPLQFSRSKTKELFAYLILRNGAQCTNNEIIAILWEDKSDSPSLQSQFRHLVADLTKTLKKEGAEDILVKRRGNLAIIPDKISCDLYDYFAMQSVNNYMGEFMAQYSWSEFSNAYLEQYYKR